MFQKTDITYASRKYIRSLGLNCQINSFIDVANGCRKLISKNFEKKLSLSILYIRAIVDIKNSTF